MNRCFIITGLVVGMSVTVATPEARGGNTEAQEKAAKKACLVGDVDKGIEILADLYLSSNQPEHIYNQARCFEQNGKNEAAIARFQEYLRKATGLSPAEENAVRRKIEALEGYASKKAVFQVAPPVTPPGAQPPPAVQPPAAGAQNPGIDLSQPTATPAPQKGKPVYKRWWFWTGIGALVAGGVVTALLLSQKSAPKSPACDQGVTCVP